MEIKPEYLADGAGSVNRIDRLNILHALSEVRQLQTTDNSICLQ